MIFLNKITEFQRLTKLLESKTNSFDEDDEQDDFIASLDDADLGTVSYETETEWPYINYREFAEIIKSNYDIKAPALFSGPPGVGKTEVIENVAEEIANEKGLKFVNFKDINESNIQQYVDNIKDYFIFMDIRIATLEPSDMQGIPNISDQKDFLMFKIPAWAYICTLPGSNGILFFDEINQGRPDVVKTLYSICHPKERKLGSPARRLGDGWAVFAAGNFGSYGNDPLPQALVNRFETYSVKPDVDSWIQWATTRTPPIYKYIVKFIENSPVDADGQSENFYTVPQPGEKQFPSPRAFEKLSNDLYELQKRAIEYKQRTGNPVPQIYDLITKRAAANCGKFWALKFRHFLIAMRDFSLEKLAKEKLLNRSSFEERQKQGTVSKEEVFQDKAYAYVAALSEKVQLAILKEAVEIQKDVNNISKELREVIRLFGIIINDIQDDDLLYVLMRQLTKGTEVNKILINGTLTVLAKAGIFDKNALNTFIRITKGMGSSVASLKRKTK